jgi:hypothetical protein
MRRKFLGICLAKKFHKKAAEDALGGLMARLKILLPAGYFF